MTRNGFDGEQYRQLVRLFWWLDVRSKHGRTSGGFASRLALNGLAYGIAGTWTLVAVAHSGLQPTAQALVLLGFTMAMVAFALVSGYDALIGPAATVDLTGSWPISPSTFAAAKATILAVHIGLVALPLALPAAVWLAAHGRPGAAVLYLIVSLTASLAAGSVALTVTLWLMGRVAPIRFRRVLVYGQAAAILGLLVVYQGLQLTRAGGWLDRLGDPSALILTPPGWFAALWAWATGGLPFGLAAALAVALSLVAPLVSGLFLGRRLPDLLDRLRQSDQIDPAGRTPNWVGRVLRLLPDAEVRAGFALVEAQLRGDRSLRTRFAPLVAMPVAVVLFGLLTGRLGDPVAEGGLIESPATALNLSLGMVALFTASVVSVGLRVSAAAEASWLFGAMPVARPGRFLLGTRLALAVRLWLPLYLVITVASSLTMPLGHSLVQTAWLGLATALVVAGWSVVQPRWPLSEPDDRLELTGRFLRSLAVAPLFIALVAAQDLSLRQPGATVPTLIALAMLVGLVEALAVRRADRLLGDSTAANVGFKAS